MDSPPALKGTAQIRWAAKGLNVDRRVLTRAAVSSATAAVTCQGFSEASSIIDEAGVCEPGLACGVTAVMTYLVGVLPAPMGTADTA
jgi:hypothetical protein